MGLGRATRCSDEVAAQLQLCRNPIFGNWSQGLKTYQSVCGSKSLHSVHMLPFWPGTCSCYGEDVRLGNAASEDLFYLDFDILVRSPWTSSQSEWYGFRIVEIVFRWSETGCGNGTLTISSPADATAIASCTIYSGSIAIATSVAGAIELDGVEEILEDLVVEDVTQLTSLSSTSLRRIARTFTISNTTLLSTLAFPSLTSVETIKFFALNAVSEFTFTSGLSSVSNITIEDTFLSTLDGIKLLNADNVQITNNLRLTNVSLPLETAKVGITIESNGNRLILDLPQLTSAGFITLHNISGVSIPSLNHISGGLLLQNSYLDTFGADSLSVVTGDLTIHDNSALTNISFHELLSAGSKCHFLTRSSSFQYSWYSRHISSQ